MRRRQAPLWPLMALTVAIAAMAFVLSFDALRTLAIACGVQAGLAWMFPLIIDAPVLAFTWATWVFKTRGLGQAYPWAMLIVFSLVSLIGNALHAHPVETNGMLVPQWGAALLMTMPPVALLATSHMMVRAASRSYDIAGEDAEAPNPPATSEPESKPRDGKPAPMADAPKPELESKPKDIEPAPMADIPKPEPEPETGPKDDNPTPEADAPKTEPESTKSEPEPKTGDDPTPEADAPKTEPASMRTVAHPAPRTLEERWGRRFAGEPNVDTGDLLDMLDA